MWLRLHMYKVIQTETGAGAAGGFHILFCTSLMLVTTIISHFTMASTQLLLLWATPPP